MPSEVEEEQEEGKEGGKGDKKQAPRAQQVGYVTGNEYPACSSKHEHGRHAAVHCSGKPPLLEGLCKEGAHGADKGCAEHHDEKEQEDRVEAPDEHAAQLPEGDPFFGPVYHNPAEEQEEEGKAERGEHEDEGAVRTEYSGEG